MISLAPPFVLCKTSTPVIHVNLEKLLQYWQLTHDEGGKPTSYLVWMTKYNISKSFIIAKEKPESHIEEQKAVLLPFTLCVSDINLAQRIQIKLNTLWAAYKCIKCQQLGVLYKTYCINFIFKINYDWIFTSIYLWRVAIWLKGHWRCHNGKGIPLSSKL